MAEHIGEVNQSQSKEPISPTNGITLSDSSPDAVLSKPVVVPQTTNIFFIKSFSPFTRSYSSALADLPNPISQDEFLAFIDGANDALLASSALQLSFVTGGMLMNVPLLPVQAAGAGVQALSVLVSAGISYKRVNKYIKEANRTMFGPRNLEVQILDTKKMMIAIGFDEVGDKGKLKLPPLIEETDEIYYTTAAAAYASSEAHPVITEDPRMRRLRALDGHVAPLSLEAGDEIIPEQWLKKFSTAPTRWMNSRDIKKMNKARAKWLAQHDGKAAELGGELAKVNEEITTLSLKAEVRTASDSQNAVESELSAKLAKRDAIIEQILQAGDKKMKKSDKREAKVANRILWIVVTNKDKGTGGSVL